MGHRLKNPKFQVGEEVVCDVWWGYCQRGTVVGCEKLYKQVDDKGRFYHDTKNIFTKSEIDESKGTDEIEYIGDLVKIKTKYYTLILKHRNYRYKVELRSGYTGKKTVKVYDQEMLTKLVHYEAEQVAKRLMKSK